MLSIALGLHASPSAAKRLHAGPQEHAMAIFAAIEGAQLVARGGQDIGIYDRTIRAYRSTGLIP